MKIIYIVTFILFLSISGNSQIITILDKSNLQPIENVALIGKESSTVSDKNGNADLSKFKPDEIITFKHIAYQSLSISKNEILKNGNLVLMTDNIIKLNEIVFSANKMEEKKSDIPQKIDVITAKTIAFNNPQTTGDVLQQSGNVFIQQSQLGGSSPVLRGFEANKVLMVIDGVRMNNAIYRAGHLQNVITIDPNVLDRVEVIYGPGSVMYGSDAIGGVMSFFSKNPVLSLNEKTLVKSGAFTRYSSASNEFSANVNLNFGFKKLAFLTSISCKNLGDLRMGNERETKYGDWGKSLYYAERINGKDSTLQNPNPNIQKKSGYSQYDILQKILYKPNTNSQYVLNLQYSNSSNVPRYDRLAEMLTATNLKYADWYYGPQTRIFASLKAEYKKQSGFYDNASITAAYQYIKETRVNRLFNDNAESHQEETVNVLSLNADLMKKITVENELRYGIEAVYNHVGSQAYAVNITNNSKSNTIASRYPDDGNKLMSLAAYATHNWEIRNNLIFSQGIRLTAVSLESSYSDTMMMITKFPFEKDINQNNIALNGNIGLVYMPAKDWRIALMGSTGFRAPNVDDVGKVNDSKSGKQLVIPNPDLKPEYAYNADFTIAKTFFNNLQLEFTAFYTLLKNAIVVQASTLNGQDSIIYKGKLTAIQTAVNVAEAYTCGIQANLLAQLNEHFSLSSNFTYTYGIIKGSDLPLDHIPPVFGVISLKYETKKFKAEIYDRYCGWKLLKDYSLSGEDNLPQATVDGMPSWFTLNFRTAYQFTKVFNVQLGMENILDRHYRYFASGISAPGRNLIVALKANF